MIISDTAVKKSTTVVVLALLLIVIGVYSYMVLPRESDPDVTIPNVFISTSYRGVSPTDIETSITTEIEKKLKGLNGLKKVQSVSSEGLSSINVEFITGTDIDQALQDVKGGFIVFKFKHFNANFITSRHVGDFERAPALPKYINTHLSYWRV